MSSISPSICQAAFYKTPPPITSSSLKVNYYKLCNNNNNNRPYYICNYSSSSSRSFTYVNWRYSCFKDQKSSSDCSIPETSGDALPEEQEQNQPNVNWLSNINKIADTIFSAQPWTTRTILQVMLLWITSFWFVGSWIIPFLAHISGLRKETLTYRGQAFYSLLTDVAEGIAGIAILHRCLAPFRPLSSDWFKFSIKGKWKFDVGLGCLMFPLVNRLSQVNLNLLPMLPHAPVTVSSVEQSIVARDPVAMALYAVVVTVCAPIWEEVVFRGFLLPSLTRYMPVWCSILQPPKVETSLDSMFTFDVIEEILLRSDAKDLVPWKRVCKSWYSLISSPRFAKAHLRKKIVTTTSNELRIAMPTYWKIPNARLYEYNKWKVAGSSNGLVCLFRMDEKVSLILLSNPCTREVRRLPMSSFVPEHRYMEGICLSFAYDSSTDDYKVVMEIKKNIGVTLIQVLSLRSNTWKLIGEFDYEFMPNQPGILLHGALHWVVLDYSIMNKERKIISFDLSREEFKVIPQPNHPRYEWHSRRSRPVLGIVDDQICLFFLNRHNELPREIWVMRSYNVQHSWELLPENYEMKHQVVHHMKMVEFLSPKNKRMSFFCDYNKCSSRAWRYIRAHQFLPSLVSPYAVRPSHSKNNKTSVKSWSIQAVKGEGQHSQAMLRRTIVEPSEQEARMIEELYRQQVGDTENLYLHEDESREIVTICAERGRGRAE